MGIPQCDNAFSDTIWGGPGTFTQGPMGPGPKDLVRGLSSVHGEGLHLFTIILRSRFTPSHIVGRTIYKVYTNYSYGLDNNYLISEYS